MRVRKFDKYNANNLKDVPTMFKFLDAIVDYYDVPYRITIPYYIKDIKDSCFYILQVHNGEIYWQMIVSITNNVMSVIYWNGSVQHNLMSVEFNTNKLVDCIYKGLFNRGDK